MESAFLRRARATPQALYELACPIPLVMVRERSKGEFPCLTSLDGAQ